MKATENKFPHNKEQVKIYFQYFPEDETFLSSYRQPDAILIRQKEEERGETVSPKQGADDPDRPDFQLSYSLV